MLLWFLLVYWDIYVCCEYVYKYRLYCYLRPQQLMPSLLTNEFQTRVWWKIFLMIDLKTTLLSPILDEERQAK